MSTVGVSIQIAVNAVIYLSMLFNNKYEDICMHKETEDVENLLFVMSLFFHIVLLCLFSWSE